MNAMNGIQLGTKQIIVRLHEPKQLRQEKLAARFGGSNGHPRSASGATSPTPSEAGDSYLGWASPRRSSLPLASPIGTPDRGRRGSGSYYNVRLLPTFNQKLN
jgi:polyadenylate-binding protein